MKKGILGLICLVSIGFLGACDNETDDRDKSMKSTSSESLTVSSSSELQSADSINLANYTFKVSSDEAIAIFKAKHPDTTITKIQLDTDFGQYKYQVTGVDETMEYELKVDAETKDVTKEEQEALDNDELNGRAKQKDGLALDKVISVQKAIDAGVTAAKSKNVSGRVTEWTLENDNQQSVYEVKIMDGRQEIDVTINGIDGNVLEIENDE